MSNKYSWYNWVYEVYDGTLTSIGAALNELSPFDVVQNDTACTTLVDFTDLNNPVFYSDIVVSEKGVQTYQDFLRQDQALDPSLHVVIRIDKARALAHRNNDND